MMNPKVYTNEGPRRELNIEDLDYEHGLVWIKYPDGRVIHKRIKSITLELE